MRCVGMGGKFFGCARCRGFGQGVGVDGTSEGSRERWVAGSVVV